MYSRYPGSDRVFMKRFYIVQINDSLAGWQDTDFSSQKELEVIREAESRAKRLGRYFRVIRKSKGWKP